MKDSDISQIQQMLDTQGYVTDRPVAIAVYLAMRLQKPLLGEGPAGVGKTEIAKVMAKALDTDLIRLQCYEGLDASTALYEWNYQRQLLHLKLVEQGDQSVDEKEATLFSEPFLLKRPLLQAITHERAPVLLIDELDRADEEFESFLVTVEETLGVLFKQREDALRMKNQWLGEILSELEKWHRDGEGGNPVVEVEIKKDGSKVE